MPRKPKQPSEKGARADRRATRRTRIRPPAFFWAGIEHGRGILHDVSMTGARIEEATIPMSEGTSLRMTFGSGIDGSSIRLSARVVRQTDSGFAVEFVSPDGPTRERLEVLVSEFGSLPPRSSD